MMQDKLCAKVQYLGLVFLVFFLNMSNSSLLKHYYQNDLKAFAVFRCVSNQSHVCVTSADQSEKPPGTTPQEQRYILLTPRSRSNQWASLLPPASTFMTMQDWSGNIGDMKRKWNRAERKRVFKKRKLVCRFQVNSIRSVTGTRWSPGT